MSMCGMAERLKEEEGRRKAGEDQALRMDGVLAALRQEATALRLAAEEHAKWVTIPCSVTVLCNNHSKYGRVPVIHMAGRVSFTHPCCALIIWCPTWSPAGSRLERCATKGFKLASPVVQ